MNQQRQQHWNNIYQSKQPGEVSWTQEVPQPSLDLIRSFHLPASASIIDVGGGDAKLAEYLLQDGYSDVTVLDISEEAIRRAQLRLGPTSKEVEWQVTDICSFRPRRHYDVWHDRAAFHFLTTDAEIQRYTEIVHSSVSRFLVIGTFSPFGPKKCSGLDVRQYNDEQLTDVFKADFEKINCFTTNHKTPSGAIQNFIFCCFKRKTPLTEKLSGI